MPTGSASIRSGDVYAFIRALGAFGVLAGLIYAPFFAIHSFLPHLRTRGELVNWVKREAAERSEIFDRSSSIRVAAFGDSRVLCSFIPSLFDEMSGGATSSFNFGLVIRRQHIGQLERLCARGECPTHVLLSHGVEEDAGRLSRNRRLPPDTDLIERAFPFRDLPKNAFVFLTLSFSRGGPKAYYEETGRSASGLLQERGYRFIEWLSEHPDHQLPAGFSLPSDSPQVAATRDINQRSRDLDQLLRLARKYDFELLLVPQFFRKGQFAPAAPRDSIVAVSDASGATARLSILGPDYWLFDNKLFSDPDHLNRQGADLYTRMLWRLIYPSLSEGRSVEPSVARRFESN